MFKVKFLFYMVKYTYFYIHICYLIKKATHKKPLFKKRVSARILQGIQKADDSPSFLFIRNLLLKVRHFTPAYDGHVVFFSIR